MTSAPIPEDLKDDNILARNQEESFSPQLVRELIERIATLEAENAECRAAGIRQIALTEEANKLLKDQRKLIDRLSALAEWVPIDEIHLPKAGDEVACFDGAQCVIYEVTIFHTLYSTQKWRHERGMTHYRPINAPAPQTGEKPIYPDAR